MKDVINPIDREILKKELTKERLLRPTNYSDNEIYVITHHDSPNLMLEIGRLRELTFRAAGGGTDKEVDIDSYDTSDESPYNQLIVWDPEKEEILGGYRFMFGDKAVQDASGKYLMGTTGLFEFSEEFEQNYLPYSIELGRSFVQPLYQSRAAGRKGMFALDNLWDGLGALMVDNPRMKYFLGKVTMYMDFNRNARDLILYFMEKQFPDTNKLVYPKDPIFIEGDKEKLASIINGATYKEDHKILSRVVRDEGELIPPLINAYLNLTPSMLSFGTSMNSHFGEVEETGILITIDDIYDDKKERHVNTYIEYLASNNK